MIDKAMLRKWQEDACAKWLLNGSNGIFLGCTGSGKSIAAMYPNHSCTKFDSLMPDHLY